MGRLREREKRVGRVEVGFGVASSTCLLEPWVWSPGLERISPPLLLKTTRN